MRLFLGIIFLFIYSDVHMKLALFFPCRFNNLVTTFEGFFFFFFWSSSPISQLTQVLQHSFLRNTKSNMV